VASKAFTIICDVELGKPHKLPEYPGIDPVRANDGLGGRGFDKKRMTSCNEVYRGSKFALTRKGADPIVVVSHCMKGGKPVNVSSSITPSKGERLTDKRPKLQWTDVDWKMVEEHVNRLQTRIAKAVKQGQWNLVKRLRYLLTNSYYAKLLASIACNTE
jgi:RNA-directed DNA polymerase